VGDTIPIPAPRRGLSEWANLAVQLKFVPVPWYDGSANLMASTFKCSTLSHPTGDIEKNRVRYGHILIPNELDLNFWVPDYGANYSSKLTENCNGERGDRHTDTQTRVNLLSAPWIKRAMGQKISKFSCHGIITIGQTL